MSVPGSNFFSHICMHACMHSFSATVDGTYPRSVQAQVYKSHLSLAVYCTPKHRAHSPFHCCSRQIRVIARLRMKAGWGAALRHMRPLFRWAFFFCWFGNDVSCVSYWKKRLTGNECMPCTCSLCLPWGCGSCVYI